MKLSPSAILFSLVLAGCSAPAILPTPHAESKKNYLQNPKLERKEYLEIKRLYTVGAYEALNPKVLSFEKRFPGSEFLSAVYNIHGLAHLLNKKTKFSVPLFERALELDPSSDSSPYIEFNLATALQESGAATPALQHLLKIEPDKLNSDTKIKYHFLKSKIHQNLGNHFEAANEALISARISKQANSSRPGIDLQVEKTISQIQSVQDLQTLFDEHKSDPGSDKILLKLGKKQLKAGNLLDAQNSLKNLIDENPKSTSALSAQSIINSNIEFKQGDPISIGILLPQTGKLSNAASAIQHSVELAFGIYSSPIESPSPYTLFFADSGSTAEQAIAGLEELYSKHKVLAVIGPVSSKGIDSVTSKANDLGLPLFPLSQIEGSLGDWTVQANITLKNECEEMARNAVEKLNLKRFAILYPKHRIAELAMQYFWDKVEKLGGSVVGLESYTTDNKDYSQVIDRLTGRYYTESRAAELETLAEERIKLKIKKRTRKTQQYFDLPPIVDFDAVFIPDDAAAVSAILPFFKYRDVSQMTFLGISAWNSPELFRGNENPAEGSYFVDDFSSESLDAQNAKFVAHYQEMFSDIPSSLDAAAYDTAKILTSAINSITSLSRSSLKDQIKLIKNYKGVTGLISHENGALLRPLKLLKVQNAKISEAR